MKYILTDIEGTTTSISFVHEVLFPYSNDKLSSFLINNIENISIRNLLMQIDSDLNLEKCNSILKTWIAEDKKHPVLKTLQGLIWEQGYAEGTIKGHIYADVPTALESWKTKGLNIGIYSSGSTQAQKLLFSHSIYGDLTKYFSHYFDTAVGFKRETASYLNIAKTLNLNPHDILFLSDIIEELDAAKMAGMQTIQLLRNNNMTSPAHLYVESFLDILALKEFS